MNMPRLVTLSLFIMLAGCTAAPVRDAEAPRALREAERYYEQALEENIQRIDADDEARIRFTYRLGRIKGFLCEWQWAEDLLKEAVMREDEFRESGDGPSISRKSIEVARLYFDRGLFASSLPYFEQGIDTARRNGLMESDPIAFAEIYEEYALALEQDADPGKAQTVRKEAATLRKNHPGQRAQYVTDRYWAVCPPDVENRQVDIPGWDGRN